MQMIASTHAPRRPPAALFCDDGHHAQLRVDFGFETDPGRRFALWCLMHLLGQAPDLDVAFQWETDRDAARNLMDLLAAAKARA